MLRNEQDVVEGEGCLQLLARPEGNRAGASPKFLYVVERLDVVPWHPSIKDSRPSCRGSVAFLVLFPAAARTGVVAADLWLITPDGLHSRVVAADAGGARRRSARARGCRCRRKGRLPTRWRKCGGGLGCRIVQHQG